MRSLPLNKESIVRTTPARTSLRRGRSQDETTRSDDKPEQGAAGMTVNIDSAPSSSVGSQLLDQRCAVEVRPRVVWAWAEFRKGGDIAGTEYGDGLPILQVVAE